MATKRVGSTKPKPLKALKKDPITEYKQEMEKDGAIELLYLADDDVLSHIKRYVSTQSIALDKAIGYAGVPCGRITEIAGDNHTGKSTIADHILAQTLMEGGIAILVDTEHGRDQKYAKAIGIDPTRLLIGQPKRLTLEGVFEYVIKTVDWWVKRPEFLLTIVVDSIAGLPTEDAMERGIGDQKPGEAARTLHQVCRLLSAKVAQRQVALIFVNQLYATIGNIPGKKSYGGDALPYHASLRLRTRRGEAIKRADGVIVGQEIGVEVIKSKINGSTGAKCGLAILHGIGVDNTWTIYEAFRREGYITMSGNWSVLQVPGESEPRKWQHKFWGLLEICNAEPELFQKLVQIYVSMPGV